MPKTPASQRPAAPRATPRAPRQAPTKAEKTRLTRAVSFRLPDAVYVDYQAKVKASGMKSSDFFRECILQNRTQIVARPPPSAEWQRLLYLFNKTSNNVNQLAHRAHRDYNAGVLNEDTYSGILNNLDQLVRYMKAVLNDVA